MRVRCEIDKRYQIDLADIADPGSVGDRDKPRLLDDLAATDRGPWPYSDAIRFSEL